MKITASQVIELAEILEKRYGWTLDLDYTMSSREFLTCNNEECKKGKENTVELDDEDNLGAKFCKFCGETLKSERDETETLESELYLALVEIFE